MQLPIINILCYGMTACITTTIVCIVYDVDPYYSKNIVLTITLSSIIKNVLHFM